MIQLFNYERDAKNVMKWGEKHQFPLLGKEYLPDIGYIIDDAAVGFLYTTNSKIGWLEWVFSNPEKTVDERRVALDILMHELLGAAKLMNIEIVITASGNQAYAAVVERNGFTQTDSNMSHYVKVIEG